MTKKKKGPKIPTLAWVIGLLVAGAASSVLGKAMYGVKANGLHERHYFKKPWMETLLMFIAMTVCLFLFAIKAVVQTTTRLAQKAEDRTMKKSQAQREARESRAHGGKIEIESPDSIVPDDALLLPEDDNDGEEPVVDSSPSPQQQSTPPLVDDEEAEAYTTPPVDSLDESSPIVNISSETDYQSGAISTEAVLTEPGEYDSVADLDIEGGVADKKKEKKEKKEKKPYNPHSKLQQLKLYIVIAIPAMCDMIATVMMSVGLLWTTASVWQMLRGSILLFTALITIVWLKRRLRGYHWIGIILCTIALIMVGASALLTAQFERDDDGSSSSGQSTGNVFQQLIGIALITAAQFVQALQTVIEEVLLKNLSADPILVVGVEGFWGAAVMIIIFCPILYFIPGSDAGSYENSIDSVKMMFSSWTLLAVVLSYMFVILWYNVTGMFITKQQTCVHRNIQEAVRTLCVWVADLTLYYILTDGGFGEAWTVFSWLELAGFVVLVAGMFIYNRVIKIPIFNYDQAENYDL